MLNLAKRPLSEAIRIAVWECVNVESGNVPDAELNMYTFGTIRKFDAVPVCMACMAGFALRGIDPDEFDAGLSDTGMICWPRIDRETRQMMMAIDKIRCGFVQHALNTLSRGVDVERKKIALISDRLMNSPYKAGHYPWENYLKAADMLQELGL